MINFYLVLSGPGPHISGHWWVGTGWLYSRAPAPVLLQAYVRLLGMTVGLQIFRRFQ